MASEGKKIDIAIVGGGMGGLCTAIGLLKLPHVNVQVYEAAHKFSEIGAGVAFGPNAKRALQLIGPETEQAFKDIATGNGWKEQRNTWFEFRWGSGPHEGELIAAPQNEQGQQSVHRAKFLDEFVKLVPQEIAHFGKRLIRIEHLEHGRLQLIFKDGTTAEADTVIGAEGIHSICRKYILGNDHPAANPVFTGSVAYRGLIPMEEAAAAIGEKIAANSSVWLGHGAAVMIYPVDHAETMNIVAYTTNMSNWEGPWVQNAGYSKIKEEFSEFGKVGTAIVKMLDRPQTQAWSLWDHLTAPVFCKDRVVMMGDAAHATTPFQGQGAGQAIEDAFVIQRLFAHVKTADQISLAYRAYDRIRRPRTVRVVTTSREACDLTSLQLPGVMDDGVKIKEAVDWRMDWIWHRDVALEAEQAVGVFEKLVGGEELDPEQ